MQNSNTVVIGTRASELALKQVDIVSEALRAVHPDIEIIIKTITTQGDTNNDPIPKDVVGKGWFTKEIEEALLHNTIDIAVHSLKDVGEDVPDGLMLAAYLSRSDAHDVLITKHGESLEELKQNAVIGTDSPRRQSQMLALRGDLVMKSIRGNVPTRLKKLDGEIAGEEFDAIILARAGLERLELGDRTTRIFEYDEMTPAPGQGTLVVEARKNDQRIMALLAKVNVHDVAAIAQVERSFARKTGAGCKSPVGAYAYTEGGSCTLIGMVASDNGKQIVRGSKKMPWEQRDSLGAVLAQELLIRLQKSI